MVEMLDRREELLKAVLLEHNERAERNMVVQDYYKRIRGTIRDIQLTEFKLGEMN